ncbi:MAG: PDGLE domain-containing protein [Candidatus Omnitrophota bacterium]
MKRKEVWLGLLAAFILGIFLSPFASQSPDGLERVAGDRGFLQKEEENPAFRAPVPDYQMPGIGDRKIARALAGALGVAAALGAGYGLARALKKKD